MRAVSSFVVVSYNHKNIAIVQLLFIVTRLVTRFVLVLFFFDSFRARRFVFSTRNFHTLLLIAAAVEQLPEIFLRKVLVCIPCCHQLVVKSADFP